MINITISFTTLNELQKSLDDSIIQDSSSTLIQLYFAKADLESIKTIQTFFSTSFPSCVLIGATTDGTIQGSTVFHDTTSVVTFTTFEKTNLKSALLTHDDYNANSFFTGHALATKLCTKETKLLLTFGDGIRTNGEEFVKGIKAVEKELVIAGGLAADSGKLVETFVFDLHNITSNGAVGVVLDSQELTVTTDYTFDWMPIGKKLQVTKAIKNRIYEIDNISVVDIYSKYLGKELADKLPKIGIEFPLIYEKDGVNIGRAVLEKHDDGSLTFAGNIQEGDIVHFGVGNIERILKNSDYQTRKLQDELKYQEQVVFVFSCMARRRFMQQHIDKEIETLSRLGDVSGFFTYGEFFHTKNSNLLLNETMTILAISESSNQKIITKNSVNQNQNSTEYIFTSEHAIAHLANAVSIELEELNDNLEKEVAKHSDYIYKQAYFDKLTTLPNRISLIKSLQDSIGKVIFLINIDDFTTINDFYGHEAGDFVLKKLSIILQDAVKDESTIVYKLPSDEFAMIKDVVDISSSLEMVMSDISSSVENETFTYKEQSVHVSVTISAAFINEKGSGLANADMALKLAKKASKDIMVFNEDLKLAKQYETNIKMVKVIKQAIFNDGIIPYFQPIYDIKTQKIEKYECLVRLKKENDEILSPFFFLDISQKIRYYSYITEIMVEKSFAHFAKNGLNFSINLAFSDILNIKTRKHVFKKIKQYDIGKQLTIEILETQEMDNDSDNIVSDFIQKIYELGAVIAIDDFGSGYANFEHITTIRSDYMKIDGSLIKKIDTDLNAKLIVETIIGFAKKLGKKTIAEFVHSQDVYDVVKELGIDFAQGYHLGMPLPHTQEV